MLGATALMAPAVVSAQNYPMMELWFLLDASDSMFPPKYPSLSPEKGILSNFSPGPFHYEIQREGHVRALRTSEVVSALVKERVTVNVAVWAGTNSARILTPNGGIFVQAPADVEHIASIIENDGIHSALPNSLTNHYEALRFVLEQRRVLPDIRLVIDISTDAGIRPAAQAKVSRIRDQIVEVNGTINVLAVDLGSPKKLAQLNSLYDHVRSGFLLPGTYEGYFGAIFQKMLMEITAA